MATAAPLAEGDVQVFVEILHYLPPLQSASSAQLPVAMHLPAALHRPERHTVPAVPDVQLDEPRLSNPHLLSRVSQTPDAQVSAPAAVEQTPLSTGVVWAASVGTEPPLLTGAVHVFVEILHHLPPLQSVSTEQASTMVCEPTVKPFQSSERLVQRRVEMSPGNRMIPCGSPVRECSE